MGRGISGLFYNTYGAKNKKKKDIVTKVNIDTKKAINDTGKNKWGKIFSKIGHVTLESISKRREKFLGKSVAHIEHILQLNGYETVRRSSKYATSRAKIIVTTNSNKERNITQVQISPGSQRHGNVPYVKLSTSDIGRIKIIGSSKEKYKTDNREKAIILFRRKK